MECYLSANRVLLKDFESHVRGKTAELIDASLAEAKRLGRPITYLPSSSTQKEPLARDIVTKSGIRDGLIGVFTCVEPAVTFELHRNRQEKKLEVKAKHGRCMYVYHYHLHPVFGFMYARVQTWFPFAVQIGLNGREWLARQMDKAGLAYRRQRNKFS